MYAMYVSRPREEVLTNRIEAIRLHKNLTRQELADLVGVHYQTIGYLERGEYSPSLALALRISQALNTPVEKLFSAEKE